MEATNYKAIDISSKGGMKGSFLKLYCFGKEKAD